jgi:hypothetical protein
MIPMILRRVAPFCALLLLVLMAASCGLETPSYEPGNVAVFSNPPGALIFVDDDPTGLVTPDTLLGLERGTYQVSVVLDGFVSDFDSRTAVVSPLTTTMVDTFLLSPTTLVVTSEPEGASIFLNGEDIQRVTPATLVGVPGGEVEISLLLDGYLVAPASTTFTVIDGQANELPAETFAFRYRHTVLFEGFSNVSCQGCPDMAVNMDELMHRDGFGLDRVLYVKYSMSWPSPSDPHYLYNQDENNDRMFYYQSDLGAGIPVLAMEGFKVTGTSANSTPYADEIEPMVEANQALDPGFIIDVTADFSSTDVPVQVTLTALDDVSLAGKTLVVALVQTFIEYETPPGNQGETEFHNVFRDRADNVDDLLDLAAGETQVIDTALLRGDWDLSTMLVVAFVQDDTDHTIFQAGSTATVPWASVSQFKNASSNNQTFTSGGERP